MKSMQNIYSMPQYPCFSALFEAQVERTPDAVALAFEEEQLTYSELDLRANQLAAFLQAHGVAPEVCVGLCVQRSVEMIIGLLAILKAGGAYVPIDPTYPKERIAFILRDAQIPIIITQLSLTHRLPEHEARVIYLDSDEACWTQQVTTPQSHGILPQTIAYIIYTSGSTGTPKGTLIAQQGLRNLVEAQLQVFQIQCHDRVLQFASLSFDASIAEIAVTLSVGATLCLQHQEALLPTLAFVKMMQRQDITTVTLPPSLLTLFSPADFPALRTVISAGEACSPEIVQRWSAGRRFFNAYGPTEATVCASIAKCERDTGKPTIGRAIQDVQVYILDADLQSVPVGIAGELSIGGPGVARGYLHRPDLTAERFVPHPLSTEPGQRLYRSGDLARFLPNGEIDYLGRLDHQVKLRGFRIELGEIELTLRQYPGVQEAVVLCREDVPGEQRLVAYILPTHDTFLSISALNKHVREKLPEYMAPALFEILEQLPLTSNGKIDRQALPIPQRTRPALTTHFVPPSTPLEQELARIWSGLLRIEHVGINDNFFELGGNSLLVTQLIARLRESLHIEFPIHLLFSAPSITKTAHIIEEQRQHMQLSSYSSITPHPEEENHFILLSFSQERVWFLQQLNPTNMAYNAQATLRLTGQLDVAALNQSLGEIIRRHEIFRTTFPALDGIPVQKIHTPFLPHIPLFDLQSFAEEEREAKAQQLIAKELCRAFDLAHLPLVRWMLIRFAADQHLLVHVEHHLVHDGWSFIVFLRELQELYRAFSSGKPSPLAEMPIQFAHFADWQRQWVQGEEAARQLAYWKEQLTDSPPILELPTDHPRPSMQSFQGASLRIEIPLDTCHGLRERSRQEDSTLFMTMFTAFVILLHRYSRQDDICVGSGIANRRRREAEDLIGMIINTIVLRTDLSGNPTFRELLDRVRKVTLDAYANQDLPFEKVVEVLKPERNLSHNPLFQVMFAFHDSTLPAWELPGLDVQLVEGISNGSAKFDMNLTVIPHAEQRTGSGQMTKAESITVIWEYNTDLFSNTTIKRMVQHYLILLKSIIAYPERRISTLPMLTEAEQRQLLFEWNDTQAEYPRDLCIHELFEAQVERTPDTVAVVFAGEQLSYRQLNAWANQLAHHLKSIGVGPASPVAIHMERSLEMIPALLGILKAGGIYVPVEISAPVARLQWIIASLQIRHIVTGTSCLSTISMLEHLPKETHVVCLDTFEAVAQDEATRLHIWTRSSLERHSQDNPQQDVSPNDLAYIIFTSGSTGTPKGVMVRHQPVVNLIDWVNKTFSIDARDRGLFITSLSFDLSVYDIFGLLAAGASIQVVSDDDLHEPARLLHLLYHEPVTFWDSAPAALEQLIPFFPSVKPASTLRLVFLSGDWIPVKLPDIIRDTFSGSKIISLGGATEATIWSNFYPIGKVEPHWVSIPYGKPIQNAQYYVLDSYLNPCPVGVPGYLYIGGECLASGYIQDPELTSQKFLPHPFHDHPDARLYQTGDMARFWPDGNIEFLGRLDTQVKIRGFRVELGEIEVALTEHPAVRNALVVTQGSRAGDKQLMAYLVPQSEQMPTVSDLRSYLKLKLPDYMIPATFIMLEALPLTPNGKIDRKALPEPDQAGIIDVAAYVAPRNSIEEKLVEIWTTFLGLERIGIHHNFFEMGGHSLLATQIMARVREVFQVDVPLRVLFENPGIAELATAIVQWQAKELDNDLLMQLLTEFEQ
jgi:amino acid adenylation domain-containing protein